MYSYLQRAKRKARTKTAKAIAFFLAVFMFVMLSVTWGYQARQRAEPSIRGVSFSTKYAQELGLDYQRTLLALLDEANIKHFRLMSYWDTIEVAPGIYDFEALDWQIDQVARHEGTITLAIGQRQPRWPECHIPDWASVLDEQSYNQELLQYIRAVVERYRDEPALISWQLENEAANRHFGVCPPLDESLLERERNLIQTLDNTRPVVINTSNQSGTPLFGPIGDSVGYSIYKKAGFEAFGRFWNWNFWYVPSEWHSFRAAITEGFTGADTFIHELQAEPWGPEATVNLSREEQDKTMDPDQLRNIVNFAEDTGMRTMYLWGGEWWYWRYTQFEDQELWDTVKEIYDENSTQSIR